MRRRKAAGRKHGPAERKGERKNRVLPLDYLQRNAKIVQDRHDFDCNLTIKRKGRSICSQTLAALPERTRRPPLHVLVGDQRHKPAQLTQAGEVLTVAFFNQLQLLRILPANRDDESSTFRQLLD